MKLRSMRVRMTLVFALILAPFLIVTSHLVVYTHRMGRAERDKRTMKLVVEKAAGMVGQKGWEANMTQLFSSQAATDIPVGALVASQEGKVLWRSAFDAPTWPIEKKGTTIPVPKGDLTLYINAPAAFLKDEPDLNSLFTLSTAAVLAFSIAGWFLIGRTLSPIRALAKQAEAARVEETGRLTAPSQDAEIRELVTTLNGFLDRMEEASDEKSRFYAAASHELRTPLQALLGHLEVCLAQARTAKDYQGTIQEAHVQTQRLVALVEGILLLHHLQGQTATEREEVCLVAVVEETLEGLMPLIEARDLQLQVHFESDVRVSSAPTHLGILVRNLVENAAKYGREGGRLAVYVTPESVLRIENVAGSSIEVDRLFEPFYRRDASRSTKGGYGLGLAICRAIAKANGWSLSLGQEGNMVVAEVNPGPRRGPG